MIADKPGSTNTSKWN